MKSYEKESFIKTFSIFFISLSLLSILVAFFYYSEQKRMLNEQIFSQMRAFTYDFKQGIFEVDVIPYDATLDTLSIKPCDKGVCGYFRIESAQSTFFKVSLEQNSYDALHSTLWVKVLIVTIVVIFAIGIFAVFYALYALYPLKKALHLLEDFLKDVIHDLHTPVTSILLNVQSLSKKSPSEELERIELGSKTIVSLYDNLESLYHGFMPQKNKIDLEKLLHVRSKTYQKLYPKITFIFKTASSCVESDSDSLARIFDNLISNACKYNTKNGTLTLSNDNNSVMIEDSGIGIKRCDLVFERYYKENERGLGLGLNIVKKLCDALFIEIEIKSKEGVGTSVKLSFPIKEDTL